MDLVPLSLLFGLVIGIKHALEADHIVAVATLVTEHKNPFKASLIGTFWGIGHTTILFVVGLVVLLLRISIPDSWSKIAEFFVGMMLVYLGIKTITKAFSSFHTHTHSHGKTHHDHPHINHLHVHHRSFLIGFIHGLAGSGSLMVLVLSTMQTFWEGIIYILLFGIGSIVGMTLMSFIFGIPLAFTSNKFLIVEKYLKIVAGVLSIVFGLLIIYEIGFTNLL